MVISYVNEMTHYAQLINDSETKNYTDIYKKYIKANGSEGTMLGFINMDIIF